MEYQPLYSVKEFNFSIHDTETDFTVMCKEKSFHISLAAESFNGSTEHRERYLHFLQVSEAFELDGLTVDDFYDWIFEPFLPIFRSILPPKGQGILTLQNVLFPDTFKYTLRVVDGNMQPVQVDMPPSERPQPGVPSTSEVLTYWPSFTPSRVRLDAKKTEDVLSRLLDKVFFIGQGACCYFKPYRFCDGQMLEHELRTYRDISQASLDADLRICRLLGTVRDGDIVYGLLLSYIDSKRKTLTSAIAAGAPIELRNKWAGQIGHILRELHKAEIAWGDAKPDNLLIDVHDDAWMIDFGGGYTQGWVDRELAGTIEGDLQAFAKILSYMGVEARSCAR